jgi:hypothetical protein
VGFVGNPAAACRYMITQEIEERLYTFAAVLFGRSMFSEVFFGLLLCYSLFMQMHRRNTELCTLMYSHGNVRTNASCKVSKHSDCSSIFPFIFSWDTIQIFIQQGFINWSKLLICFSLINTKKLRNAFDEKRLSKLKRVSGKLSNVNPQVFVD